MHILSTVLENSREVDRDLSGFRPGSTIYFSEISGKLLNLFVPVFLTVKPVKVPIL